MAVAKAAIGKVRGLRKAPAPLPSQDNMDELLDRFMKDGFIQVQVGESVYTIENQEGTKGCAVSLYWKGPPADHGPAVKTSRRVYGCRYGKEYGQELNVRLYSGNFYPHYGFGEKQRQAAEALLVWLLSGVQISMMGCGVFRGRDVRRHRKAQVLTDSPEEKEAETRATE